MANSGTTAALVALILGIGGLGGYLLLKKSSAADLGSAHYEVWDKTTGADAKVGMAGTGGQSMSVYVGDSIVSKQVSGTTSTPGSTIAVYWNGAVAATAVANAAGYWEVDGTILASQVGTNKAYAVIKSPNGTISQSDVVTIKVYAQGGGTSVTGTAT